MGVYINGMEMPKENEVICIFQNGIVQKRVIEWSSLYEVLERSNAIPIPPHGRLIDADALLKKCEFACTDDDVDVRVVRYSVIEAAPTIIEAEENNNDR